MVSPVSPHQREETFVWNDADAYVDSATTAARHASLALLGDKIEREGQALILVADLQHYDAVWAGKVALQLVREGRSDDAAMWARAQAILDAAHRAYRQ